MATMFDRVKRAVMLDAKFYQEAEADKSLNQEALIIVVLASVAGGVGALIGGLISGGFGRALLSAVVTIVVGVVNYYIWSYVTYFVGTRLFGGDADPGELLRTLGYAYAPQLLSLLSFIPCVGGLFSLAGAILSLIAAVIAIREALDFDLGKAILTAIIGWVIILVISVVIGLVFGVGAAGIAALGSALGGGR
jgi:hypothetical protein